MLIIMATFNKLAIQLSSSVIVLLTLLDIYFAMIDLVVDQAMCKNDMPGFTVDSFQTLCEPR
jgi:hypothetical protein